MPRDLGDFHVMVNVPEFMVRVVDDGAVVHETRVVVGKPTNPTPTFSHVMDHLVVNPYWNVPTSIVTERDAAGDPAQPAAIFRAAAIRFSRGSAAATGRSIPYWVDWYAVKRARRSRSARCRATSMRSAASSSCSRTSTRSICTTRRRRSSSSATSAPSATAAFASRTRSTSPTRSCPSPRRNGIRSGWRSSMAARERRVNLDTPVPVHLAYFTACVDAGRRAAPLRGHLRLRQRR